MHKIKPREISRTPWKNGGGETAEIAVGPPNATIDTFEWRVSTARVAVPGPFSAFAGVDRTLVVLSGCGLRLTPTKSDGGRTIDLGPDSAPYSFAGDIPLHADLIDGEPVVDFNVMTRRDRFSHTLRRADLMGPTTVAADVVLVFCIEGRVECRTEDRPMQSIVLSENEVAVADGAPADRNRAPTIVIECRDPKPAKLLFVQILARGQHHD